MSASRVTYKRALHAKGACAGHRHGHGARLGFVTTFNRLLDVLTGDTEVETLLGDEAQLAARLRFEVALAQAEADAGLIPPKVASAIADGPMGFLPDWPVLAAGLERDGVVVPALVAQLREAVAAPHRGSLHLGATSQDVVDTALMMQLAQIVPILLERLERCSVS